MHRSYLFAPGHNAKLLSKVFDAGADAVMLDLEDAVPPHHKETARAMVADVLAEREGWVRINAVRTRVCEADLDAVADLAVGIRVPKVESAEDAQWVAADETAPGYADRLAPLPTAVQLSWLRRNPEWRLVFERDGILIFQRASSAASRK